MGNNYKEVIVIDLESTCWETYAEKALNTSEMIEIGVCVLDVHTGEIKKRRGIIVNPKNSKVSQFCIELTSITQDMVNHGVSFEQALKILKDEYQVDQKVLAAWGNYDQNMLLNDSPGKIRSGRWSRVRCEPSELEDQKDLIKSV